MSVLDDIIAGVREDLAAREAAVGLDQLKEAARRMPSARDGVSALRNPAGTVSIISEVKRASPSKGALSHIADPAALAAEYEAGVLPRSPCSRNSAGSAARSPTWRPSGPPSTSPSSGRTSSSAPTRSGRPAPTGPTSFS